MTTLGRKAPLRRPVCLLTAVLLVAATALTGAGAAGADATTPTLSFVGKSSGFGDEEIALVKGSGFTPNTAVIIHQCSGERTYPPGDNMNANAAPPGQLFASADAVYCGPAAANPGLEGLGNPYTATVGADGTLLARVVISRDSATIHHGSSPPDGWDKTLTYDDTHPGAIVAHSIVSGRPVQWPVLASMPITFAKDQTTFCSGTGNATAQGAGGTAGSTLYAALTAASCTPGKELAADYTETGEQAGLMAFENGDADFALSPVGLSPPGGEKVAKQRDALFVPVALEAATVAFAANSRTRIATADTFHPVNKLDLTIPEATQAFKDGNLSTETDQAVKARNPELGMDPNILFPPAMPSNPRALGTPEASTLALTTAFTAYDDPATPTWRDGVSSRFVARNTLNLSGNSASLRKSVLTAMWDNNGNSPVEGANLIATDSLTAAKLNIIPAGLENAHGAFVAPTEATVQLAVAGMTKQPDGTLFPNAKNADPVAYALPLVMYAVIPANTTAPHLQSTVDFVRYALGDGQQHLPPGAYSLPADMRIAAQKMLPTPTSNPGGGVPNQSAPNGPGASGAPLTSNPGGIPPGQAAASLGVHPTRPNTAQNAAQNAAQAVQNVANTGPIPLFPGLSAVSELAAVLGLTALITLLAAAGYTSSGRTLPLTRPLVRLWRLLLRRLGGARAS